MTLRDSLDDYKRCGDDGTMFPGERRSTSGLFSGLDGRLVHIGHDGALRDFGYPLTGLNGVERSRLGLRRNDTEHTEDSKNSDAITWFDECPTQSQSYHGDTALVVTEHKLDDGIVFQYDLTICDAHLTRFEVDFETDVDDDFEIVAFVGLAPEAQETRIGQLRHDAAVEVYHAAEHDFIGSTTGFIDVQGEVPATFAEILGDNPIEIPRETPDGRYEESRLSGNLICSLPTEGGAATLVSLLTDQTETSRTDALARLETVTETHASRAALERAAADQISDLQLTRLPRAMGATADLRVIDLLSGPTGLRIAGPDFDPFYAHSGGYGYTWFRDDAEISRFLLDVDRQFDLGFEDQHAAVARIYCDTQHDDGTWPHRVWPRDATLAPGWANGRLEAGDDVDYQADQTGSVVAYLATYLRVLEDDRATGIRDDKTALASEIATTIEHALDGLDDTLAADGRPVACQNAWENATGRFAHTTATFLEGYAAVAATDLSTETTEHAAAQANRVYDALDDLWVADRGIYALREQDGNLDTRCDSATLALASAHRTYDRVGNLDTQRLDRLASHVRTVVEELERDTGTVRGLIRFEGDDWRMNGQDAEKIWTVSTAWGAHAATNMAALLEDNGEDSSAFESMASDLLSLVLPDGVLCASTGYLPEQVFDDGTPDSATPLGWPHALRLATIAAMEERGTLRATPMSN
ncbi:glycoside hydrolase family 15 protein [Haladaptatus sp. NG-SE-30]